MNHSIQFRQLSRGVLPERRLSTPGTQVARGSKRALACRGRRSAGFSTCRIADLQSAEHRPTSTVFQLATALQNSILRYGRLKTCRALLAWTGALLWLSCGMSFAADQARPSDSRPRPRSVEAGRESGQPLRARDDQRSHLVFVLGENEYQTSETLPEFARRELEPRGFRCSFVAAPPKGGNEFENLEALKTADLVLVSVRRRTPPKPMLELLRQHLEAGKPLIGIRTASHAFDAKPADDQHAAWSGFDREVLGARYEKHYSNDLAPTLRLVAGAAAHPLLNGVAIDTFRTRYSLYRNRDLAASVTPLLTGTILVDGREVTEPVAWCNTNANRRVFYTSLGGPDDFKEPAFRRLLLNGVYWSLNRATPKI